MGATKIQWCDRVWNPVTGCTPISEGCEHCYAKRMSKRLAGRYGYPAAPHEFDVTLHEDKLDEPLKWKASQRVFLCSMGDLFHPVVPVAYQAQMLKTIALCPQHVFLFLTKRPEQMLMFERNCGGLNRPNIWLGVSAETQACADERIPILLQIPAAKRFVSVEPMLGQVNLMPYLWNEHVWGNCSGIPIVSHDHLLDWVIAGGETGPGARPMHPNWLRSLRDQCQNANVPFFFKQWGGKGPADRILDGRRWLDAPHMAEPAAWV